MQTNEGLYVVLEGIDGAGKSTQIPRIQEYLESQGNKVVLAREPYDTPIAADLFKYVLNAHTLEDYTKAMLMLACRYDIQYKKIKPALEEGCIVLSDRSFLSMLSYQLMYTGHSDHGQIRRLIELSTYVVRKPDRIFLFDLPTSVALSRCDSPPFAPVGWTNAEYLEQVRKSYIRMFQLQMVDNAILIDALKDGDNVFLDLKKTIDMDVEDYRARILERHSLLKEGA